MGREIKRVPVDFDWPLERIWAGYQNPYAGECSSCETCGGSGHNAATKRIEDDWYDFARTGRRWCDKLEQPEVDALIAAGRLMDFTHRWIQGDGWKPIEPAPEVTAEQVNAWASGPGFGHDTINRWICVESRAKRLGVYGSCDACDGQGEQWTSLAAKALAEAWEATEPPEGTGWQVWETVSEGSPVSPVFATAEELIDYLAEGGDSWNRKRNKPPPSREACERFVRDIGWVPSMVTTRGRATVGIESAAHPAPPPAGSGEGGR